MPRFIDHTWVKKTDIMLPIKVKTYNGKTEDGELTISVERGHNTNVSFCIMSANHDKESVIKALSTFDWDTLFKLPEAKNYGEEINITGTLDEPTEMTVEAIYKALGKMVKIVK